jgi:hypothetical protein
MGCFDGDLRFLSVSVIRLEKVPDFLLKPSRCARSLVQSIIVSPDAQFHTNPWLREFWPPRRPVARQHP